MKTCPYKIKEQNHKEPTNHRSEKNPGFLQLPPLQRNNNSPKLGQELEKPPMN